MPPSTTTSRTTALRYMTRFSCIGQACEDHCCHGWQVQVDQEHLARIRMALKEDPEALGRFDASYDLLPAPQRRRWKFAQLKVLQGDTCALLDSDRLCSLHRRLGPDVLPSICLSFPRSVFDSRGGLELTGVLACPEATRLCLLSPDATDVVEIPREAVRGLLQAQVDAGVPKRYLARLAQVRRRMHALLGRGEFPLRSRLYFTVELINQLRPLRAESDAAAQLVDAMDDGDMLGDLHDHFQRQRPRITPDLGPVVAALEMLHRMVPESRFSGLSREILRSYVPAAAGREGEDVSIEVGVVLAEYQRRSEAVLLTMSQRVDLYLQNWARHLWVKEWTSQLQGLDGYVRGLVLRLVLLRFLLLSHPEAVLSAEDPDGGEARLDRIAVALIYSFSRALDGSGDLRGLLQRLALQQVPDLGAAIAQLAL